MRKIFILSFILLLVTNYQLPIFAISPTPTPTTTDEIQKIRQAIQEKVKEKLQQINNQNSPVTTTDSKRAIIGTLIQSTPSQITLDYRSATTNVNIGPDTIVIDLNRNKTKLANLKIGQDLLVLGILNDQNIIDAKRIVFSDLKTITNPTQTIVGHIVDISRSSPIFVLIPSSNKNLQYQLKNDSKTIIVDSNNKTLDTKSLITGQRVIAIVKVDPKSTKTLTVLKLIDFGPLPTPTAKPTKP